MRLALVRQKYTPFGGAERYMARLIEALRECGHELHLFASAWDRRAEAAITVHRVPTLALSGSTKALTFALNSRRMLQQYAFDVVVSLERTLAQDIYRAGDGCHRQWLINKRLGAGPLWRHPPWLRPLDLVYLALERRLYQDPHLSAILANSQMVKREIIAHYGVAAEKIQVVYNGVVPAEVTGDSRRQARRLLAERHGLGEEELRILCVGSGFRRKGVPWLIQAVARLPMPCRLLIVGKGATGPYRRLAQRLKAEERVVFCGPQRDVSAYYRGSDCFVLPTLYDPFSNATLEAMAYGLPAITTAQNGAAEVISHGESGFILPDATRIEALMEAIESLAAPDVRARMGAAAKATADQLTMDRNVRESLEVIAGVAKGRSKALAGEHDL